MSYFLTIILATMLAAAVVAGYEVWEQMKEMDNE